MRAIGQKEDHKHREGKRNSPKSAIRAKCYQCMCSYDDGREECGIATCALYPYMPYTQKSVERRRGYINKSNAKVNTPAV